MQIIKFHFLLVFVVMFVSCLTRGRLGGNIIETYNQFGQRQCLRECAMKTSCLSINYNQEYLICEISFKDKMSSPEEFEINRLGYHYAVKKNTLLVIFLRLDI